MRRKNYGFIIFILILTGIIAGLVIYNKASKENLRDSITNERKLAASAIEKDLPGIIEQSFDYIEDAGASVTLSSNRHHYTNYKGKENSYMTWEDNVTLTCTAKENFNRQTDAFKLEYFQDIVSKANDEADKIQAAAAPVYSEYYSSDEIVNVFDVGVFCGRNVDINLTAGETEYVYHGYSWHVSEVFERNGVEKDPSHRTFVDTPSKSSSSGSSTKTSVNSSSKKTGSSRKSYNYDNEMPDCDDYEDYDEFMDDWDGNMPDGSDAEDYWENW